ncbi:hypothetical protein [Flavobacterium sp. KACC 22761]|uniref:hypothetical protein n=1 Tax=Flavobacterium sp. KACC 22761 TaxID=3092665 RepID=UPI002A74DFB4|nr:hypothetical protein [Flavobacterium sp. KACC 22761]WPO79079.1 hypothetical protein SCB73_01540 [Flavobacterium sp. KACC 22761]
MKDQKQASIPLFLLLIISCCFLFDFSSKENNQKLALDLVKNSTWYIAGPAVENQETINKLRLKNGIVKVTANESPKGEIELNVMITPSDSNDGKPTNISEDSKFVSITYKSSHLIKVQAREGNEYGTGCVHGGSHPRVNLDPSPKNFITVKIPWTNFRQDGLPDGKLLNIHNLCKFNFVNYNPVTGASLEIKSVQIQN